MDVRRAQHAGAADRRSGNGQVPGARRDLVRAAPAHGRGSHPRPAGRTFRSPRRCRLARRRVQRRRPADGDGAAQVERIGHCWTNIRTSPPMSPAAKRGPPSSVPSTLNWRFSRASSRPADEGPPRVTRPRNRHQCREPCGRWRATSAQSYARPVHRQRQAGRWRADTRWRRRAANRRCNAQHRTSRRDRRQRDLRRLRQARVSSARHA